jgi:N-acetylneuraminic acid mutarotase
MKPDFTRVMLVISLLNWSVCRASPPSLQSTPLAALPNSPGVAGPFVGVAGGALIVGGGTNFPDRPPWKNGSKTWYDTAYVLPSPDAGWLQGFKLPHKRAYGVSLSTREGLLCIGGCDESRNVADVYFLRWDGKALSQRALPKLPVPTSCSAGAMIGSRVYIAGGQPGPNPLSGPSQAHFWMLDLADERHGWSELPTWPGPERFFAVAGSDGKAFYLFSGIRRILDSSGQPVLEYLKDAYRFDPAVKSWARLADLPHANAAVASPATDVGDYLLLLGRGADGVGVDRPLQDRAEFGTDVLGYNVITGKWHEVATLPFGRAAVPSAPWRGGTVVASGESRPGIRSNEVWWVRASSADGSR